MECPVCKEEMIVLELDEVEIDHCLECGGIWLDNGELELLLESVDEKDAVMRSFAVERDSKEQKYRCPICLKMMEKIRCGKEQRILIDKCRNDHGLWFDRGELPEVIAAGSLDKDNKIIAMMQDMFAHSLRKDKDQ